MIKWDLSYWMVLSVGVVLGGLTMEIAQRRRKKKHQMHFTDFDLNILSLCLANPGIPSVLVRDFERFHNHERQGFLPLLVLGSFLRQAHQPQKALRLHQSLLARQNLDRAALNAVELQLSLDKIDTGSAGEARDHLKSLPRAWQKTGLVQYLNSLIDEKAGDLERSTSLLRGLLKEHPGDAELTSRLNQLLLRSAKADLAQARFAKVEKTSVEILDRDPKSRAGLLLRADLALAKQDNKLFELVIRQFQDLFGGDDPELLQRLGGEREKNA